MTHSQLPKPKAVSSIMIDGGTTFHNRQRFSESFVEVHLPALCAMNDGKNASASVFVFPNTTLRGRVHRNGENVIFDAEDAARIEINIRENKLKIEARSVYLWVHGLESWYENVLIEIHKIVFGETLSIEELVVCGWTTTEMHLCCDFTGIPMSSFNPENFTGRSKYYEWKSRARIDGVQFGLGKSEQQFVIYDKSEEIRQKRAKSSAHYETVWARHGYDGSAKVTRIEFRTKGRALTRKIRNEATSEEINFRDPAVLLERHTLDRFWGARCHQRRYTETTNGPKRRAPVASWWKVVTDVGDGQIKSMPVSRPTVTQHRDSRIHYLIGQITRFGLRSIAVSDGQVKKAMGVLQRFLSLVIDEHFGSPPERDDLISRKDIRRAVSLEQAYINCDSTEDEMISAISVDSALQRRTRSQKPCIRVCNSSNQCSTSAPIEIIMRQLQADKVNRTRATE